MSVVINDFEIIPGSSGDEPSNDADGSSEREAPTPRRAHVVELIEREKRRRQRLRAH